MLNPLIERLLIKIKRSTEHWSKDKKEKKNEKGHRHCLVINIISIISISITLIACNLH